MGATFPPPWPSATLLFLRATMTTTAMITITPTPPTMPAITPIIAELLRPDGEGEAVTTTEEETVVDERL